MRTTGLIGLAGVGGVVAATTLLASSVVHAQQPRPKKNAPFILQREQLGATASAEAARARARKGDCAGALEGFDAAIRTSIEPTLRRDRGLCHERLGNPFPAIEDFRVYLTASADANDSADIRERLMRLEAQVGVGGPSEQKSDDSPGTASASMRVSVESARGAAYDSSRDEDLDESGPLRRGEGGVVGAYFGVRRWFGAGSFGGSFAETVGLRVGYSLNRTFTLLAEAGYMYVNTSTQDVLRISGLSTQVGFDARVPFDRKRDMDNLVIFGLGIGYEHLVTSTNTILAIPTPTFGSIGPRGRIGYRHNFGPKVALEVSLDGGVERTFIVTGGSGGGTTSGLLGMQLAILFGM